MADRLVRLVLRDARGEISYLMGAWGVASGTEVHSDIRCGRWRYTCTTDQGNVLEVQEQTGDDGPTLVAIDPSRQRDVMAALTIRAAGFRTED